MAAYDLTRSQFASAGIATFAGRIGAGLASVWTALADWNDARQTRKALSALSDHELDDIGMTRGDIDTVARRSW